MRCTQTCFLSQYINFIEVSWAGRSQNERYASRASGMTCHFFHSSRLSSDLELSEDWLAPWSEDDVDVPTGHDLCYVLPVVIGRWTSLRRFGDTTLGRGATVENSKPPRKRWQSSLRSSSRKEGAECRLWLEDLSYLW